MPLATNRTLATDKPIVPKTDWNNKYLYEKNLVIKNVSSSTFPKKYVKPGIGFRDSKTLIYGILA